MFSKTFITYQLDDMTKAAAELSQSVCQGMELKKNTIGMVVCYSDADIDQFAQALQALLPFKVIGCSCIVSMDAEQGLREMAIVLMVLTADDCEFAVGVSDSIQPDNVHVRTQQAYHEALCQLSAAPRLIYAIPPHSADIMLDEYTEAFNDFAESIPVIGGLPSSNGFGDRTVVIANGDAFEDRLALVVISGNIRPVFDVRNVNPTSVELKRKVTDSVGNVIYKVGNQRFTDYMLELGFLEKDLNQEGSNPSLFTNPLLLENIEEGGEANVSLVRTIFKINFAEGSGVTIGKVPMGATLSISTLSKEDIIQASLAGMRNLISQMQACEDETYQYSTVLAISCMARYQVMLPVNDAEAKNIRSMMPQGMAFSGFYGFGEIGPSLIHQAKAMNFAYNESLILCAL